MILENQHVSCLSSWLSGLINSNNRGESLLVHSTEPPNTGQMIWTQICQTITMVAINMLSTVLNASHNPLYQFPQKPCNAEMKGYGISQRLLERFLRKYNGSIFFKIMTLMDLWDISEEIPYWQ